MVGGRGSDFLTGGSGNEILDGGSGTVSLNLTSHVLVVDGTGKFVYTPTPNLTYSSNVDKVSGNSGSDVLIYTVGQHLFYDAALYPNGETWKQYNIYDGGAGASSVNGVTGPDQDTLRLYFTSAE